MSDLELITLFVFNIVVYSVPLLYATCGEILTEKSGSLNLGVEGTMAVGAIVGYVAGCRSNSFLVALLVSFAVAALVGAIFAFFTVTLQANQNVTGLTITTLGVALYFFIGKGLSGMGKWPVLSSSDRMVKGFKDLKIPGLSGIKFAGKAFFTHNILVYASVVVAILLWVYIEKTIWGLKLRAIGENPSAADSLGVNVNLYKYIHIMVGSGIMGIGGLYMGLNMSGSFEGSNCWINGYGWIAIALVIFANWSTLRAIGGTFVFGFFNTLIYYNGPLANQFPHALGWLRKIPSQFYSALPFIITLLVLIISSINKNSMSGEPAAKGINYYREDR